MADEEAPAPIEGETNPDGSPRRDLRFTAHEESNVRVDRSLDGSGHLARGDHTRMSVLSFSSRHAPRTERDPDFTFRPAPKAAAPAEPVAAAQAPGEPAAAAPAAPPPADSVVDKVRRFLGI